MADYNSDRTGSNIDLTLDKVDALDAKVQPTATGANVTGTLTADGLTVDGTIASPSALKISNTGGSWNAGDEVGRIQFYTTDGSGIGEHETASIRAVTNQGGTQTDGTLEFWRSPYNSNVVKALEIDGVTGDVSFYEDTGTTAKMVWDASAESLGIGTASPYSKVEITGGDFSIGGDAGLANLGFEIKGVPLNAIPAAQVRGYIGTANSTIGVAGDLLIAPRTSANTSVRFITGTSPTERMRIDSAGNVGIGTDSPSGKLEVNTGSSAAYFTRTAGDNGVLASAFCIGTTTTDTRLGVSGNLTFKVGAVGTAANLQSEKARIDSSGNLLVGKSVADVGTAGTALRGSTSSIFTVSGSVDTQVAIFNKTSVDGTILDFRKDGSTVGSIGIQPSGFYIDGEANHSGLRFGSSQIQPRLNGTASDGGTDLGSSFQRFKDLYLSGGVYLGGTGAANKLDDYEEGVWTPTFEGVTSGSVALTNSFSRYTKVGNTVHIMMYITNLDLTSHNIVGGVKIDNLPFTISGYSVGSVTFASITNLDEKDETIACFSESGTNELRLIRGSSISSLLATQLDTAQSSARMMLTITYQTNA